MYFPNIFETNTCKITTKIFGKYVTLCSLPFNPLMHNVVKWSNILAVLTPQDFKDFKVRLAILQHYVWKG